MASGRWLWFRRRFARVFSNEHTLSLQLNLMKGLPLWTASLITGFLAVAFTRLFGIAENAFHSLREWNPYSVFLLTPLSFTTAFLLVRFFAPAAKGSGIPQVMAALDVNRHKHPGIIDELLGLKIILTKIFSSLLMVQGGGAIGREGPTIQIASSIFRMIDKQIPSSWPRLSSQNYILTGAAAGLAAAFNTPLGGIVFAMEELAKIHLRHFRTSLFVAVIIAGLTAQGILGPYLYLGYPSVAGAGFFVFFTAAIVAILSGAAGAGMCRLILIIRDWRKDFTLSRHVVFTIVAGLLVAAAGFYFNDAIFGSGKEIMNGVLFGSNKSVGIGTVISRIMGSVICFNTGAAGGIFAPSLAAGASVGGMISGWFELTGGDANVLILCGMVGFLTGVTRTPFTSAILVLEMTDRHGVIFHLMFAAILANIAAVFIMKHSLYEVLKREFVPMEPRTFARDPLS